ncbi:MAG: DUF6311 domain-containing protein [Cyanobium sp.]
MSWRPALPLWARGPFWPLALLAVAVWLTAWGPCAAPWQTGCFSHGGWGDYKFHYQGWISYLHSDRWIPPTSRAFTWPETSSVMFTDSLPLAAIVFKPFTRLLRLGDWQYLSLLSLANGLLIAGCSATIARVRGWRPLATLCIGALLLTAPVSWSRLVVSHEALQLQGLLLLALTWLIAGRDAPAPWILLSAASLGIHAYFTPMLLAAALVAQIRRVRCQGGSRRRQALALLRWGAILALTLAAAAWVFGFQSGSASSGSEVWGANGLALLDPQSHSLLLPPLRKREPFEVEGFAYLGIGVALGAVLLLAQQDGDRRDAAPLLPPLWWAAAALLFLAALGPTWNLADTPITPHNAVLALPGARLFYDLFRSAGRFTWPLAYSLLLWVGDGLARQRRQPLLLLLTALQLLEVNLRLIVRLGDSHRHRLWREADPVLQWQAREPALAAALSRASLTLLGTTRSPAALPPPYAPQRLNPAIESNWGGVGITRLPRQLYGLPPLEAWIAAIEERLSRGQPALLPHERVLVISEDPQQRARLTSLARRAGLRITGVGSTALQLSPSP